MTPACLSLSAGQAGRQVIDFEARRVCTAPCAPSPAGMQGAQPRPGGYGHPRPSFPTRLYRLHPCRRALSPYTGNPVHRGCGHPRPSFPTRLYRLHPCRRALSPYTGLPVHRGYGHPALSPHTGHPVHRGCGLPALSPHTGHPVHRGCGLPALSPHTGHPVHNILSINEGRDKSPDGFIRASQSAAGQDSSLGRTNYSARRQPSASPRPGIS